MKTPEEELNDKIERLQTEQESAKEERTILMMSIELGNLLLKQSDPISKRTIYRLIDEAEVNTMNQIILDKTNENTEAP